MSENNNDETENMGLSLLDGVLRKMDAHPLLWSNRSDYAVADTNVELSRPAAEIPQFTETILKVVQHLEINKLTGIQTHSWPHLSLGDDHGVYMIGPPLSGRTLGFLMPLCQTVSTVVSEYAAQWADKSSNLGPGPLAIVVAADVPQVERIEQLCKLMLGNLSEANWISLVATFSTTDSDQTLNQLLNNVGCLVVTLAQFVRLKKLADCIKYPELRYVVFDDIDIMEPSLLQKAFPFLLDVVKKSMQHHAQLVLTSQSYDMSILEHLRAFNKYPMVVFGDVLEASYYGGVPMKLRILKSSEKLDFVLQILRLRPPSQLRTMIYCNSDSEIEEVENCLVNEGYKCLAYYLVNTDLAVRERVQCWADNPMGEVLVAADGSELNIRDVHTLIHYNMSDTWATFKMRYLVFTNNLRNHLKSSSESSTDLYSSVLLDEANTFQLPRLTDYLKLHYSFLPKQIGVVDKRIRKEIAMNKIDEPALCPQLMGYGSCKLLRCPNRHQNVEYDRNLPDWMPTSGDVRFIMQKMYSPVHYNVRLLEFKTGNGNWLKFEELGMKMRAHIRLQMFMGVDSNRRAYWPPMAKEVCVCNVEKNIYERVRVLNVSDFKWLNIVLKDLPIEVQSMDTNRRTFWTTSGSLYKCPKVLQIEPPMSFDMRFVGLLPSTRERSWYEKDTELVREWLRNMPTGSIFQAKVIFSTSHTIFAEDVVALKYSPNESLYVQEFNMRQKLCDKLAISCPSTKSLVLAVFMDHISYLRATDSSRLCSVHLNQQNQQQDQSVLVQATDYGEDDLSPDDGYCFDVRSFPSC